MIRPGLFCFLLLWLPVLPVVHAESTDLDQVRIRGGAVLTGTVQSVEGNILILDTPYAGNLRVDLTQVEEVLLNPERDIGLANGFAAVPQENQPEADPEPAQPAADSGLAGAEEAPDKPENWVERYFAGWNINAGLNLGGKKGNSDRFDLTATMDAKMEREFDRINLYGRYAYGTNRGGLSADETVLGGRYTNFFFNKTGLFFRQELEFDGFEGVEIRSTSAGGFSYKIRDREHLQMEARSGISFRYEDFENNGYIDHLGMDLGFDVTWRFLNWMNFKGNYTFLPALEDPEDFVFEQDSGFNILLDARERWKLRLGVSSQYNNQPQGNRENLDLSYYVRLIASWK